ncbi:MAG: hypothetical protein ACLR5I_00060 [Odoribacter splanchnicus]
MQKGRILRGMHFKVTESGATAHLCSDKNQPVMAMKNRGRKTEVKKGQLCSCGKREWANDKGIAKRQKI